jgi:DNA-binding Lrp family transcriptional regulator
MSWQATAWAQKQRTGSPSAKAVLLVLANYANEHGVCWPSQNTLAIATEQSQDSVQRRLRELEKLGLIKKQKRRRKEGKWPGSEYELQMAEDQVGHAANCGSVSGNSNSTLPAIEQAAPQGQRTPNRTTMRQELSLNPTLEYSFGGHEARGHPYAIRLANAVEQKLGSEVYKSWFKGTCLVEAFEDTVTIAVPKKFNSNYIRDNFSEVILDCARRVYECPTLRILSVVTCRL